MKTLKHVIKILLLTVLCVSANHVHAVKLTAAHFIKTFDQMDLLANTKDSIAAQSVLMELAPRFYLAAGLPAPEFNLVIFELLNKYTQHPKLRPFIQGILSKLAENMNVEIYNSRQRFDTPIVVARALTMGFTIVLLARSGKAIFDMGPRILHSYTPSPLRQLRPQFFNGPRPVLPSTTLPQANITASTRMGIAFESAWQRCAGKPLCIDWLKGLLGGAVIEASFVVLDSFDQFKVHPIEVLRIVQANLACDLHWSLYDYGKQWQSVSDYKVVGRQLSDYSKQVKEFQQSYSNLLNLYSSELNAYKKYYPKEKDWWRLAASVVDDNGRSCNQISTEAMKMDLNQMASEFWNKFGNQINADQKQHEQQIKSMNDRRNDPLYGYDSAHLEKRKFFNRPDQDPLHGFYEKNQEDPNLMNELLQGLTEDKEKEEKEEKQEQPAEDPQIPERGSMSRIVVFFIFLFTSSFAHASLFEAQERIHMYLKASVKTGDIVDEELTDVGFIYEQLDKLNKEDYRKAIEFLRDNWNINSNNAQRLFIFLQSYWHSTTGMKVLTARISKSYTDRTMGLMAGSAIMAGKYTQVLSLVKPLIGMRRNPLKAFSFGWSSGAPIAGTLSASALLQNTFSTEAAKDNLSKLQESPAEILGFPLAMPNSEQTTLDEYELSQLYTLALQIGVGSLASDLIALRTVATGVKTAGSTAGRVVLALSLATVIGFAAETSIDVGVQNLRFDNLAADLKRSIDQLASLTPKNPKAQLAAQNVYAKTINLMQFEMLGYLKALKQNLEPLKVLQQKVATNSCELPASSLDNNKNINCDEDEGNFYLAQKDIRDGLINTMKNQECQAEVDQYVKLSSQVESNPDNKSAKTALGHLTNYLIRQYTQGKFCGGYMQGHPLNLLLSTSLYLKSFSSDTWPQTQELDEKFIALYSAREQATQLELLSPHERKIRDGELPDPAWTIKRQGWIKNRIKQQPQ